MQKARDAMLLSLAVLTSTAGAAIDVPGSVGEMLQIETQAAIAQARRKSIVAAVEAQDAQSPRMSPPVRMPAAVASQSDTVELLGTYRRGDERRADLAVNGVVALVRAGDQLGAYRVKAIATHCIHIVYRSRTEMLRCIAGAQP